MDRTAVMRGDGRPVRFSSQYQASPSSMPPPTAPMMRAASARSSRPSPSSVRAPLPPAPALALEHAAAPRADDEGGLRALVAADPLVVQRLARRRQPQPVR